MSSVVVNFSSYWLFKNCICVVFNTIIIAAGILLSVFPTNILLSGWDGVQYFYDLLYLLHFKLSLCLFGWFSCILEDPLQFLNCGVYVAVSFLGYCCRSTRFLGNMNILAITYIVYQFYCQEQDCLSCHRSITHIGYTNISFSRRLTYHVSSPSGIKTFSYPQFTRNCKENSRWKNYYFYIQFTLQKTSHCQGVLVYKTYPCHYQFHLIHAWE